MSVISSNLPGREISEDGRFLVALTDVQDIVSAGMRAIARILHAGPDEGWPGRRAACEW